MAGPLNGVGGQQIPLSQPSQFSESNTQIRQRNDQQAEENRVQPQGAPAADTQNTETDGQSFKQRIEDIVAAQSERSESGLSEAAPRRGSVIDISV